MHAASQLSGRGALMWMMPLHLHVNRRSDYMIYEPIEQEILAAGAAVDVNTLPIVEFIQISS